MRRQQFFVFSGLAALAVAALGGAYYHDRQREPALPVAVVPAAPEPVTPHNLASTPAPATAPDVAAGPQRTAQATVAASDLPAFDTVRVDPSGEAVIAGRAEPGSVVAARFNGEVVGTAETNAEGTFAILPEKPLAPGTGALTLQMRNNGSVTESAETVVVAVRSNVPSLVAKVDPVAPTAVTQVPAAADGPPPNAVQINAVDYDTEGNIVFSGRARPQATVRFYVDNTPAGEAHADQFGHWQFRGEVAVAPGQHSLRADEVDAEGKVTSRIELPFFRESEHVVSAVKEPESTVQLQVSGATPEKPGTKLTTSEAIVPQRLVIQPGHNLWKLSRQIYGKGKLYTIIYEANREQLRNPHLIYPGQILTAPQRKGN